MHQFFSFILLVSIIFNCSTGIAQKSSNYLDANQILPGGEEYSNNEPDVKLTLITTADGVIHAVDSESGEEQWTLNTGPIISSHHVNDVQNREYSIIPSTDGNILIHSRDGMRKTSVKARMLSEKTPFSAETDGLFFSGSKTSRILTVDLNDGRIISSTGYKPIDEENMHGILKVDGLGNLGKIKTPFLLGRVDYTFTAYDTLTGSQSFNMSYSQVHPLNPSRKNRNLLFIGKKRIPPRISSGKIVVSASPGANRQHSVQSLTTTPNGDLYFSDTGRKLMLNSPAVTAFTVAVDEDLFDSSDGSTASDDPDSNQQHQTFIVEPIAISNALSSNSLSDSVDAEGDAPVVVVQSHHDGGLFAMEIDTDTIAFDSRDSQKLPLTQGPGIRASHQMLSDFRIDTADPFGPTQAQLFEKRRRPPTVSTRPSTLQLPHSRREGLAPAVVAGPHSSPASAFASMRQGILGDSISSLTSKDVTTQIIYVGEHVEKVFHG